MKTEKVFQGTYSGDQDLQEIKDLVKAHKKLSIKILSDSMSPLIKKDEIIEMEYYGQQSVSIKPLDVIVFADKGILTCHYVRHINVNSWKSPKLMNNENRKIFITQGLRNKFADAPIDETQILGIVRGYRVSRWSLLKSQLLRWKKLL